MTNDNCLTLPGHTGQCAYLSPPFWHPIPRLMLTPEGCGMQ